MYVCSPWISRQTVCGGFIIVVDFSAVIKGGSRIQKDLLQNDIWDM